MGLMMNILAGAAGFAAVGGIAYYFFKKYSVEKRAEFFPETKVTEFDLDHVRHWISGLDIPDFNESLRVFLSKGEEIGKEVLDQKKIEADKCMLAFIYNGKKDKLTAQMIFVFDTLSDSIREIMGDNKIVELKSS